MRLEWIVQKDSGRSADKRPAKKAPSAFDSQEILLHESPDNLVLQGTLHDINNALQCAYGTAGLLLEDLRKGKFHPRMIGEQESVTYSLEHVVDLIRTLQGSRSYTPVITQLAKIIEESKKVLAYCMQKGGHDLKLDNRSIDYVAVDNSDIKRLVMNLVVNARDAMRSGGVIEVATYDDLLDARSPVDPGRYACLRVVDHDGGIPDELIGKLFTPGCTTKGSGRGYGLAVVAALVKRNRGYLKLETERGSGSTFTAYFPKFQHDDTERIKMTGPDDWTV